jgi:hypothetical protein
MAKSIDNLDMWRIFAGLTVITRGKRRAKKQFRGAVLQRSGVSEGAQMEAPVQPRHYAREHMGLDVFQFEDDYSTFSPHRQH